MGESVKWWIRRCYTCQARKNARKTAHWPLIPLPSASRPAQMVSFGRLGPLPTTARLNAHVFLVVDLFSRHAEAYVITKEKRTRKVALRGWSAIIFRSGDAPTPNSYRSAPRDFHDVGLSEEMYEFIHTPQIRTAW